jgi:hypothetical protein
MPFHATEDCALPDRRASGDGRRGRARRRSRPAFPDGKTFVPRRWGGDFQEYAQIGDTRVPAVGKAWWELPEGRFVYWTARITGLELVGLLAP